MSIGDQIRSRAQEIDNMLPAKEEQLTALEREVKDLRKERRELGAVMRRLDGPRGGPVVTDEQILEAVKSLGGNDIDSSAVAEYLDVTKRNVARKLRKLVDDGALTGDVERGYSLVAVAA